MRRKAGVIAAVLAALSAGAVPAAHAATRKVQHLHFRVGPLVIAPGQNFIRFRYQIPQPREDGYVVRFNPNIVYAARGGRLGKVPPVDVIHLHHGVWVSRGPGHRDSTAPSLGGFERFAAAGEEKTRLTFPNGYGYPFRRGDHWILNYMIHNLLDTPKRVYITYDVDFVPARWPEARGIRAARPIWMDVMNGEIYPVFDVRKGTGQRGAYTFPSQAKRPYGTGPRRDTWTVDRDGTLVATAGHLHPGGLHTDLYVSRAGRTTHLFRSSAHYWEPAGAVSWDVAMTATRPGWRVNVNKGDVLRITATYDSRRASWYESMGIMVAFMADGHRGVDPFRTRVDFPGRLTHGHLPENDHHGGEAIGAPNPLRLRSGPAVSALDVSRFIYERSNYFATNRVPTVRRGRSITFTNLDDGLPSAVWHSITSCRAPCNRETGIAYPVADGARQFDSGQLGTGGAPTVGRISWSTPRNLPAGTYTYFCRIHPFMRGAFRVVR